MGQLKRLKILAISIWIGGSLILGGLVLPVLFYKGDLIVTQVNTIMATCLNGQFLINLACAILILFILLKENSDRMLMSAGFWLLVLMVGCLLVNQFIISPRLGATLGTVLISPNSKQGYYGLSLVGLSAWHVANIVLYCVQTLLGICLLWHELPEKSLFR